MEEIYKSANGAIVCVGNDKDYLKIEKNNKWKSVRCCKYGPGGHQQTLGYTTLAAPKGDNYLQVIKDNRIAINIIDMEDPNLIPFDCVKYALDYAKKQLDLGYNILFACNSGHSRGPSTGMAFLRSIGELPYNFHRSESIYKTLYKRYDPGLGIRQRLKDWWTELDNMELNK